MESRQIARKAGSLVALVAIATAILIVAPASVRVIAALLLLPLETMILSAVVSGLDRRISQS